MTISTIDPNFIVETDSASPDLIRALVSGVVRETEPLKGKLEYDGQDKRLSIVDDEGNLRFHPKVIEEIEWHYTDGSIYTRGRMLYSPCGILYVTNRGVFLCFGGYSKPFQFEEDEGMIEEVFHFGF